MSVFDRGFDDERQSQEKALHDFCSRLKHAVTYNDWWTLIEQEIEAQRGARALPPRSG